jgi:ribosomal protein L37E
MGRAWDRAAADIAEKCRNCGHAVSSTARAYHATKLSCSKCGLKYCSHCGKNQNYCPICHSDMSG